MQTTVEQRLMLMSRCFLLMFLIAVGWEQTTVGEDLRAGAASSWSINLA
jgi:hypothetical protein